MKTFKWTWQDTVTLICGLFAVGFALFHYGRLPDRLPMQFGLDGGVNRYGSKLAVIVILGLLGTFFPFLMHLTRQIDPRSVNYGRFEGAYGMFRLAIGLVFDAVLVFIVLQGIGFVTDASTFAFALVGLLFIILGNYMPQVKDNYFLGIRTPWTLADSGVWRKTHRLSGMLWVAAGVMILAAAFLPSDWTTAWVIAALVLALPVPLAYSFLAYRRLKI